MKYAVDVGSDVMTYVSSFIRIGSDIQTLIGGGGDTDRMEIA
jgi:hypothetical protein